MRKCAWGFLGQCSRSFVAPARKWRPPAAVATSLTPPANCQLLQRRFRGGVAKKVDRGPAEQFFYDHCEREARKGSAKKFPDSDGESLTRDRDRDRNRDEAPSFVGTDVSVDEIYETEYLTAGKEEKEEGGIHHDKGFIEGERGDGVKTLIDYNKEPWYAMPMLNKEMDNITWKVPKRSLTPQEFWHAAGYSMWFLFDDRVVKMTAKGKKQSFRALVCVGNGNGTAGYGVGKAGSVPEAYNRALMDARKNLIYLELCNGCTLWEPLVGEWNNTKVFMKPTGEGHLKCSDMVFAVANCFGITQLSSKIFGRKNPYIVMQAIFDAFQGFRTLEDIALQRGKRMHEVHQFASEDGNDSYTRT